MNDIETMSLKELVLIVDHYHQDNELLNVEVKLLETILLRHPDLKESQVNGLLLSQWLDIYDEETNKYYQEFTVYKESVEEMQQMLLSQLECLQSIQDWRKDQHRSFDHEVLHLHGDSTLEPLSTKIRASETLTGWYHHQEAAINATIAKYNLLNEQQNRQLDAIARKLLVKATTGQEAHHRIDYEMLQLKQAELERTLHGVDQLAMKEKSTLLKYTNQMKEMKQDLEIKQKEQQQLKNVVASHQKRNKDRYQNHTSVPKYEKERIEDIDLPDVIQYTKMTDLVQDLQYQVKTFERKVQLAQFQVHQ